MAVYLLFLDGIGFGRNSKNNPFAVGHFDSFLRWSGGQSWIDQNQHELHGESSRLWSVDACMGIDGLPQSGTGQASLFTGINCSFLAGKHFGPFPHSTSKPILEKQSLFHKWIESGGNPHFMNAYPDLFFKAESIPKRWSCTTYMSVHSNLRLNRESDVVNGLALTAELDQKVWRDRLMVEVPVISMREAAGRMIEKGRMHDLILFEYYLTDRAGHRQELDRAIEILNQLDQFMGEMMDQMEGKDSLVICSDHGNLEDLSVRTHTRNRVPMGVYGAGVHNVQHPPKKLTDLPSLIMQIGG